MGTNHPIINQKSYHSITHHNTNKLFKIHRQQVLFELILSRHGFSRADAGARMRVCRGRVVGYAEGEHPRKRYITAEQRGLARRTQSPTPQSTKRHERRFGAFGTQNDIPHLGGGFAWINLAHWGHGPTSRGGLINNIPWKLIIPPGCILPGPGKLSTWHVWGVQP